MLIKSVRVLTIAAASVAVLAGCADIPEQEISAAKNAVEAAKYSHAEVFATEKYNLARAWMDSAMAEVQRQSKMPSMMRSYEKAVAFLKQASVAASRAQSDAAQAADAMKSEVDALIIQCQSAVDEAKNLAEGAKKQGKVVGNLPSEIDALVAVLAGAAATQAAGDFMAARNTAKDVIQKAMSLRDSVAALPGKGKKKR